MFAPPSLASRLGALVLLASVLALAAQDVAAPLGAPAGGERSAAWLRARVEAAPGTGALGTGQERDARAAFEAALAEAQAAPARTTHDFLATLIKAHARRAGFEAVGTEGRSTHTLLVALKRQLVRAGLALRTLKEAGMPPALPGQWARWAAAGFVTVPDRLGASASAVLPGARTAWRSAAARVVASSPVAGAPPLRVLFSGRRLGP